MEQTVKKFRKSRKSFISRILVLIVSCIIGGFATTFFSSRSSDTSTVTAHVMMSPKANYGLNGGTIFDIVRSRDVLARAIDDYNDNVTSSENMLQYSKLYNDVKVELNGNSRLVAITVSLSNRHDSEKLLGLITKYMKDTVNNNLPAYKFTIASNAVDASISTPKFSRIQSTFLGSLVGLLLGFAIILFVDGIFAIITKKVS